jgi:hypothetical protein
MQTTTNTIVVSQWWSEAPLRFQARSFSPESLHCAPVPASCNSLDRAAPLLLLA